jgi:hypothetical protein
MVQDVAHARACGEAMEKALKGKGWTVLAPKIYPPDTDYSVGSPNARQERAQILFLWMDMLRAPSSQTVGGHEAQMHSLAL